MGTAPYSDARGLACIFAYTVEHLREVDGKHFLGVADHGSSQGILHILREAYLERRDIIQEDNPSQGYDQPIASKRMASSSMPAIRPRPLDSSGLTIKRVFGNGQGLGAPSLKAYPPPSPTAKETWLIAIHWLGLTWDRK